MAIKVLPEEVINKISAGEVIERPANVVKELIENSIDANSKNIRIEIRKSGKKYISVKDDGHGIENEDIQLAFQRYTTSKISSFDDIYKLKTLGFRGEALPSIASVSKVKLSSKTTSIEIEGGKIIKIYNSDYVKGTIVEVKDLFFNTPVREKFMKPDFIEKAEISHTVEEYTLAFPEIYFFFSSDDREIINSHPTKNILERIYDLLGKDIYESLTEIYLNKNGLEISGFISKPTNSFATRNYQYFFVNKRPITNRIIQQALYTAYREHLEKSRHPAAIVLINVEPSNIDVNVHPTKRMVKFQDDKLIFDLLTEAFTQALKTTIFIPQKETGSQDLKLQTQPIPPQPSQQYMKFTIPTQPIKQETLTPELIPIGTAFNTYIIAQSEDGIIVIDQHAACERILFEELLKDENKEGTELLLIPFIFTLPQNQANILTENLSYIKSLGFEIDEFGKNSFIFKSYPKKIGKIENAKDFISEFVNSLTDEIIDFTSPKQIQEEIAKSACKAAIKSSEKISKIEIKELLKKLNDCQNPSFCPHGRPTFMKIPLEELKRKFQR